MQQLDQHHGAGFAVVHVVDGLDAGKDAVPDPDNVAGLKGGGWGLVHQRVRVVSKLGNQAVVDSGGLIAKGDEFAHAKGRADRCPAFAAEVGIELNEEVAGKQGLGDELQRRAAEFFLGNGG